MPMTDYPLLAERYGIYRDGHILIDPTSDLSITVDLCADCASSYPSNYPGELDGPHDAPPVTVYDGYRCDACDRPIIFHAADMAPLPSSADRLNLDKISPLANIDSDIRSGTVVFTLLT